MYIKQKLGIPVSKEVDSNVFKAELFIRVTHAETEKDLNEGREVAVREYSVEIEDKHLTELLKKEAYKDAKLAIAKPL